MADFATVALVARSHDVIYRYEAAGADPIVVGELFGYPPTATKAFARRELMSESDQTALLASRGVTIASPFRLSLDHAETEAELLGTWQRALTTYGLLA